MGFYNILLPLKLEWLPLYSSSEVLHIGQRVSVVFCNKEYIGVVMGQNLSHDMDLSKIHEIERTDICLADISERELSLWKFISEYYLCTMGEVYAAAYPKYRQSSEKKRGAVAQNCVNQDRIASKPILYCASDRLPYYISRLKTCLSEGFSALVLVPEVEFALNFKEVLDAEFPKSVFLYDTSVTPARKRKLAEELRQAKSPRIILGSRSSLFLPFSKLGLVIVDEEQDPSYKQTEPSPRYNARDVAAVLASIHGADLILGSYTPSLESWYNCKIGKYVLNESIPAEKCRIEIVDIDVEKRKNGMTGEYSKRLLSKLKSQKGLVCIIRSYSSEESVAEFFKERFETMDPQILTAYAAKKLAKKTSFMAILNADSLFNNEDFRSDERVYQMLRTLSLRTDSLFIQCRLSSHPVYSSLNNLSYMDVLLEERRTYNMPPFSKIVDIRDKKTNQLVDRKIISRENASYEKSKLRLQYGSMYIIDIDPQ